MIRALTLLALFCLQTAAASVNVTAIRISASDESTRVVLDLSEPVDHRIFTLHDPERVVVDLTDTTMTTGLPAGAGSVSQLRTGSRDGALRIVFDINRPSLRPRSVILPGAEGNSDSSAHRLVIDLVPEQGSVPIASIEPQRRDVLIAIDPGHGGKDPGAVGTMGTFEKDVVLEISRRLKKLIDQQPGMSAMLTRESDQFILHRERMRRAREKRADFFISIHADAFHDKRVRGSSVYALSTRGATSEAARWLAERENAVDLIGGVKLDNKDAMLASVLLDLSQTAAISASLNAGSLVLSEMSKTNRIRKREVQQANFLVLTSPDIPSILVETAFISNRDEERRLRDPAYQDKLAQAMLRGITDYFADHAPPDTLLAQSRTAPGTSLR